MPSVDELLASSPLAGLRRVSRGGGDRPVALIRLAERFAELDDAPAGSLVLLSRAASAEVTDYRLDMALRWATVNRVSAVAAFAAEQWEPTVTAMDIAGRADIALVSIPANADLAGLVQALVREISGGADLALGRAQQGLDAVLRAEIAGASLDRLRDSVSRALGTPVEFRPRATSNGSLALTADGNGVLAPDGNSALVASSTMPGPGTALTEVTVPVLVGETLIGQFAAPGGARRPGRRGPAGAAQRGRRRGPPARPGPAGP